MSNRNLKIAIIAVLFILLHVIAFAIPMEKSAAFWITYGFTFVAFIAQFIVWRIGFTGVISLNSKFLGIPLIYLATVYLAIQIVFFIVSIFATDLSPWIALIINALITGIFTMIILAVLLGRNTVDSVETRVKEKVYYIKSLQVDVEMLATREADPKNKEALVKLAEQVRFSDPMSHDSLAGLEADISRHVSLLKGNEDKLAGIEEIGHLLTERNKKCKLLK